MSSPFCSGKRRRSFSFESSDDEDGASRRVAKSRKKKPKKPNKQDLKWQEMFLRLVQYKTKVGNCNVPQNYEEDRKLGRWVHYQRVEHVSFQQQGVGKITPFRIQKLESIGFDFDPLETQWKSMCRRLIEYKQEHGDTHVTKGYRKDPELANWVRNQRLEYANAQKGKRNRLSQDRIEKLEAIGFEWKGIK